MPCKAITRHFCHSTLGAAVLPRPLVPSAALLPRSLAALVKQSNASHCFHGSSTRETSTASPAERGSFAVLTRFARENNTCRATPGAALLPLHPWRGSSARLPRARSLARSARESTRRARSRPAAGRCELRPPRFRRRPACFPRNGAAATSPRWSLRSRRGSPCRRSRCLPAVCVCRCCRLCGCFFERFAPRDSGARSNASARSALPRGKARRLTAPLRGSFLAVAPPQGSGVALRPPLAGGRRFYFPLALASLAAPMPPQIASASERTATALSERLRALRSAPLSVRLRGFLAPPPCVGSPPPKGGSRVRASREREERAPLRFAASPRRASRRVAMPRLASRQIVESPRRIERGTFARRICSTFGARSLARSAREDTGQPRVVLAAQDSAAREIAWPQDSGPAPRSGPQDSGPRFEVRGRRIAASLSCLAPAARAYPLRRGGDLAPMVAALPPGLAVPPPSERLPCAPCGL